MIEAKLESEEVMQVLQRLSRITTNMRPVMADIAQALASETERQFAKEAGPGGVPWPDLSETTKAMREETGNWPGKMLQISAGGLAASVQSGYDAGAAWIGSNKPYAAMHHFGGTTSPNSMIPNRTIPARPYLPFDPETGLGESAAETILEILTQRLENAL